MKFYIIDTNTNQINPNLITGEVALFETEEQFLIAKHQWFQENIIINKLDAFDENGIFIDIAPENSILQQNLATLPLEYETITKDLEYETIEGIETIKPAPEGYILNEELGVYQNINITIKPAPEGYEINEQQDGYIELPNSTNTKYIQTVLPNEDDYQYRIATEIEKKQHFNDYLQYKIDKETETSIVITHKDFQNIGNTSRQPMIDYITAQHNEELFYEPLNYIEATGDLLNEFLAQELIEKKNAEIERIKQLKIDAIQQITNKIKNTINEDTGQIKLKEITYNLYDNTKPLDANTKTIPMEGVDLASSHSQIDWLLHSNNNPVNKTSIDKKYLFSVPINTIIKANQDIANESVKQDLLIDNYTAHINYKCKTEQDIEKTLLYLEDEKNTDVDIIKDGKISILIPIQDIVVYDNTESLLVKMGEKTLEETDITNKIFADLI